MQNSNTINLNEFIPAILTFIVGIVSICCQLTINFVNIFSQNYKEKKNKTYQQVINFYIPLLNQLELYQMYIKSLNANNNFCLYDKNTCVTDIDKILFSELLELYNEMEELILTKYLPQNKNFHKEFLSFRQHIHNICHLSNKINRPDAVSPYIGENTKKGFAVDNLISITKEIIEKNL